MESIKIDGTPKTPTVNFDIESGLLELIGRSIPENSIEFYKPVLEGLDQYSDSPRDKTKVNIKLEYFNTSSSKCILDVLKKLEGIHKSGSEVIINWHFEEDDEDMEEAGEDYQAIIQVPFNMIEVEEE
ncbi:DUF1987 domain-containing protein [Flavobacteriales bacterium]|jgi:hypothetical protein|nr:DUF1987 domain-containing protein [Flavobacteriales bacterium]